MSGVYAGSYNTALTLSTSVTNVTITGTVDAAAATAEELFGRFTISTAVYGPAGAGFTVENLGLLTSGESSPYDFGIVLAGTGRVENDASIVDSSGIGIFGTTGYAMNSGLILTSFNSTIVNPEVGIYLAGAGTVINAGTVIASLDGVYMGKAGALAGLVNNAATGTISGNIGVALYTPGTVLNAGTVLGGSTGVFIYGEGGTILNTGSIIGVGAGTPASAAGIFLEGSDVIVNGASNATDALISGTGNGFGIEMTPPFGVPLVCIGTVVNYGTIRGGGNPGIELESGTVVNGTVLDPAALATGVEIVGNNAVVDNDGTIDGNGLIGPALEDFGSGIVLNGATNDTAALIESTAVNNVLLGRNETLTNDGTIAGGSINGIYAQSGLFSNAASGVVIGGNIAVHVACFGAETVTNAGLIQGTIGLAAVANYSYSDVFSNSGTIASILGNAGTAVAFAKGNDLLIDDPGGVFIGTVSGGTGENTLALAAGLGSITGIGAQFVQFGSIMFDAGATWFAEGDVAGLAAGQAIGGFAAGDTIVLDAFTIASFSYVTGVGLEISDGMTTQTVDIEGGFATGSFAVTPVAQGTKIVLLNDMPCFAAGTRLLGVRGEIAVENVRVGDRLVTVRAGGPAERRVVWTGRRHVVVARHADPSAVRPIRIRAGALAPGVPERDLLLSPRHALYLDGVLVEAASLVNGRTIFADTTIREITYHHVELDSHDIVLAEGCAAESYLDTGTRQDFEGEASGGHAGVAGAAARCAPLVLASDAPAAVRRRLGAAAHPIHA